MNNRYLYRGISTDSGKFVIGYFTKYVLPIHIDGHSGLYNIYIPPKDPDSEGVNVEIDPDTLGQCTGKTDKNNNLIFEGDILSCYDGRIKGELIFDNRGLHFGIRQSAVENYIFSNNFLESKDIEIIGNFYHTPELLKVD